MKQKLLFILLLSLVLLLSGCWSHHELNELAIVVGMGIDKAEDKYNVMIQIIDPIEASPITSSGGRTPVMFYEEEGEGLFFALRKITATLPRRLYPSQMKVLIIGEELAKEGIGELLDYFYRDYRYRNDFLIIIAKEGQAKDLLQVLTDLERIPAQKIFTGLENSYHTWGPTLSITLNELISDLVSKGTHPVLPGLQLRGDKEAGKSMEATKSPQPPFYATFVGLAAFKDDRLIAWLDDIESVTHNYLVDRIATSSVSIPCSKGKNGTKEKVTLEILQSKTNRDGKINNGRPQVDVHIEAVAEIAEVHCPDLDLSKTIVIYDLEQQAEKALKDGIEKIISKAQKELVADIFGFGEVMRRKQPAYWNTVKGNWDEAFQELPIQVSVDVKIRSIGTVGEAFTKDIKE